MKDWSRPDPSRHWQVRVAPWKLARKQRLDACGEAVHDKLPAAQVRNIFPSMSVPREFYEDDHEGGFLEDTAGSMINPAVEHPLYLQASRHGGEPFRRQTLECYLSTCFVDSGTMAAIRYPESASTTWS